MAITCLIARSAPSSYFEIHSGHRGVKSTRVGGGVTLYTKAAYPTGEEGESSFM